MNPISFSMLYLIPTPIAADALHTIPTYALDIVRNLDAFIAERAKTARHFLKAAGCSKPLQEIQIVELTDNAQQEDAERFFQEMIGLGKPVGLLSEAGCPGVADPGAAVVALAHRLGVRVIPLPGPSSLLLALMASGMNGQRFTFHGYLSPKRAELARDLRKLEQAAKQNSQTQLFIETPYRSQMVVEVALECLQPETMFGVMQDITGLEEWIQSLPVKNWRKQGAITVKKLPAVFLIG